MGKTINGIQRILKRGIKDKTSYSSGFHVFFINIGACKFYPDVASPVISTVRDLQVKKLG